LKIESTLEGNASDGVVNEFTVALDALDDCARKKSPN
jgi:hypothetical protein